MAKMPNEDGSNWREVYNYTFDGNITSVAVVTKAFMGLLEKSSDPRVINISSLRGSLGLLTAGKLPPTQSVAYGVSKSALNALTIEMGRANKAILFQCASPGHCKTAFNGYRGTKDPLDGALVAVELALSEREKYISGFWEHEEGGMRQVPW
jgi:NAD(P)-dependent dehydrogenase (short-subunit alcohol dehydrogenase family)